MSAAAFATLPAMPLKTGSSKKTIGQNIATEVTAGRTREQAAAIAYRKAGKYKRPKKKGT